MSLRHRARHLQRLTGLSYQRCLGAIRALGAAPAALSRANHWPLARCDAFLYDRALDAEWRALAHPSERRCAVCASAFFVEAQARAPATVCASCRALVATPPAHTPALSASSVEAWRNVLGVLHRPTRADALRAICERLHAATGALVVLIDRDGALLAHAGEPEDPLLSPWLARPTLLRRRGPHPATPREIVFVEQGERHCVLSEPVADLALLQVVFAPASLLGTVRLRVRAAVAEIERVLRAYDEPTGGLPPGGGHGPTGAPAQVALDLRALRRRGVA